MVFFQIILLAYVYQLFILHGAVCSTVFIADHGMSKMIELSTKAPFCVVETDRYVKIDFFMIILIVSKSKTKNIKLTFTM